MKVIIEENNKKTTTHSFFLFTLVIIPKCQYKFSQITISQFIKDIKTNVETNIDFKISNKQIPVFQSNHSPHKNHLRSTSSFHNKNPAQLSSLPTVPKCLNECFQNNFNSLSDNKYQYSNSHLKLNLFDSSVFQWEIFNKKQAKNNFCRKHSSSNIIDRDRSSIHSLINYIQSQRQHVPSECTSWNVVFSHYQPLQFASKTRNLLENSILKNPYGRTGLIGQSLFEDMGINRYAIFLITKEHKNKKHILLLKNQSQKWTLPKMKNLNRNIPYQTLDIAYVDHPLNTDDSWIEVEIILIENSKQYSRKKTWFLMEYLDKLNNIEHFDFDLIKFYI